MPKVDITHTVSLKNRPHPDARLIRDLDTGEATWEGVPAPEMVAPPPVEPETEGTTGEPGYEPEPEPEQEVVDTLESRTKHQPAKAKKLHHG